MERPALSEPAHFDKANPDHAIALALALGFTDAKIEVTTPPADHPQIVAVASAYRQFKVKPDDIRLITWSASLGDKKYAEAMFTPEREIEISGRKTIALSMSETLLALVANRLLPQSTQPPLVEVDDPVPHDPGMVGATREG